MNVLMSQIKSLHSAHNRKKNIVNEYGLLFTPISYKTKSFQPSGCHSPDTLQAMQTLTVVVIIGFAMGITNGQTDELTEGGQLRQMKDNNILNILFPTRNIVFIL